MLAKLKYLSKSLFIPESNLGEEGRKHNQIIGFSIIALFPLLIFSYFSYNDGEMGSVAMLASTFVLLVINLFILEKIKNTYLSSQIFAISAAVLLLNLFVTGGTGGSGFLWIYTYPLFAFFLLGHREGAIVNGIVVLLMALYLYLPAFSIYQFEIMETLRLRFIGSYLVVSGLAFFYEILRHHTVDELKELSQKLDKKTLIDELTGIPNRREADNALIREFSRFERSGAPVTIVKIDFDHFKHINDAYGNSNGDISLKYFAKLLKRTLRKPDVLARFQNEEFILILPDTDLDKAMITVERIQNEIRSSTLSLDDCDISLTASFGVHTAEKGETIQEVIHSCDQKLYRAKVEGRDRIVYN